MAEVDLEFLARQGERLLGEMRLVRDEMGSMRDDMTVVMGRIEHVERVVSARLEILDETLKMVATDVRAFRSKHERLAERVRRLEDAQFH